MGVARKEMRFHFAGCILKQVIDNEGQGIFDMLQGEVIVHVYTQSQAFT